MIPIINKMKILKNTIRETTEMLLGLFVYTKYQINNQLVTIKSKYPFLKIKSLKYFKDYFIKWIQIYRRAELIINVLALINLIFTIIIIITFSNIIENEMLFLITLLGALISKFLPVFIQELLFSYYFTISSFVKCKLREMILNMRDLEKVDLTQDSIGENSNNSNYTATSSSLLHNPDASNGSEIESNYNLGNEENKKEGDNSYIYWTVMVLGLLALAGVSYYYFYSPNNSPKDDSSGGGTMPGGLENFVESPISPLENTSGTVEYAIIPLKPHPVLEG
jgi:hypothetical protein